MNKYILAIILIFLLEVLALSLGVNGLALSLSVGAICGIVGRSTAKPKR